MKYYIINEDVLCFTVDTGKSNGTMVMEKNRKFTVELECFKLLKKSCRWYGNSYNMQREFIIDKFNYYIKTLIIMSNPDKILLFPTSSPTSKKCIWMEKFINEKVVEKLYKSEKS